MSWWDRLRKSTPRDPGSVEATEGRDRTAEPAPVESSAGSTAADESGLGDGAVDVGAEASHQGAEKTERGGWLASFQRGLHKTAQLLNTDVRDLFRREGALVDEEFLERVYSMAIRTDMGTAAAQELKEQIQRDYRGRVVTLDEVLTTVKAKLRELMDQDQQPLTMAPSGLTVILVVGVNGSGKTTSIAKLAQMLRRRGLKVVLGAGDTFRAAAVEQLTIWAQRIGAELVRGATGADPASVAFQAVARAIELQADVCIVDTAGRLQTQSNLMDELAKIRRVITRQIPDAPHEVLLVLDATAGQNAISQARGFSQVAGCTGIVLAKLDGTAKGGVVIPIRRQFQIPVKYVGVGEGIDDLALFNPHDFVEALFQLRDPVGMAS